jgi:4-diphosphocytidyl-2-C-methyl-D-erythritol kinase
VISFPNCKINLGLHIVGKRNDGFHDLETIFLPIPFEDCLEIQRTTDTSSISVTGLPVEGNPEHNLCMKAYQLLKSKFDLSPVTMHLHKQIPTGAGLGGGSADGAYTLTMLNVIFNLGLKQSELIELSSQLGSDCAFFISNSTCIGTGRGNILEPIELPQLNGLFVMLVMPGIHISSAWAFQQITPRPERKSIRELVKGPVTEWRPTLENDFEKPVYSQYPALKLIKDQLYDAGAVYASLSGSGSAVYGLFKTLAPIQFPPTYTVKTFALNQKES